MLSWLSRWGRALAQGRRRKSPAKGQRRDQSPELFPTLQVRMLEERRVFHGEAVIAPVETAPPPPPPAPTTTVTLDASLNLLVQDSSEGGTNNQLTVRLDAANARYEISDPTQAFYTDIEGAEGSGTSTIYIPVAAVAGDKLFFQTGAGDDSLAVDLSGGLGGKALVFDGGAGQNDALSLSGGSYSGVGYLFAADGSTQIQFGPTQMQLIGIEPIFDSLVADSRTFTIGVGVGGLSLGDDGIGGNGLSQVTTSLGTSVTFASPLTSLTLAAQDGAGQPTLAVSGLDSSFTGNLNLNAGTSGRALLSGQLNLQGGDLRASGDEIEVSGSVVTQHATLELSARSSLTVTETGLLENATGSVLLDAGAEGTLQFSGRIDARGLAEGETGGTVHLLGWQVEVLGTASIDASGYSGGGTVLVGGDYQGSNPLIRNATNTLVEEGASIHANALVSGNGGKIIVWADEAAIVAGSGNLQARGGAVSGDGGLIETSGKRYLYVRDAADASSPFGNAGTWLLDPHNVTINATGNGDLKDDAGPPPFKYFTSSNNDTDISVRTIIDALSGTDVVINTGGGSNGDGDITLKVQMNIALAAGTTRTLTFNAHDDIIIEQGINVTSGQLNIVFNASKDTDTKVVGDVVIQDSITTSGGSFTVKADSFNNTGGAIDTGGGAVTLTILNGVTIAANISTVGGSFTADADSFNNTGGTVNTGGGALSLTIDNAVTIGSNITVGAGAATINAASVAFAGGRLSANVATLTAGGAITRSGMAASDIVISGTGPTMTLSGTALGGSGAALRLNAGSGDVNLTATSGGIAAEFTGGDFSTSHLKTLSAAGDGVTVALGTTAGNLLVNEVSAPQFNANTANDHFELSSSGDITLSDDAPLNALTISLSADDDILATSAGPHLKTSATAGTAITLDAGGTIGESGTDKSIGVQAGAGLVTATTSSSNTSDGVYITSTGPLHLGAVSTRGPDTGTTGIQTVQITTTALPPTTPPAAPPPPPTLTVSALSTTNDNWTLNSAGDIVFGNAGSLTANSATLTAVGAITGSTTDAADINTSDADGDITLNASSLGTSTTPLQLYAGDGDYRLTAKTGGLYMQVSTGNLLLSQLVLDVQTANQVLSLATKNGDVVFDDLSGLTNTGLTRTDDDNWQVKAGGTSDGAPSDITFTSADPLASRNLTLNAAGNIGAAGAEFRMQATGDLDITAGGNIFLRKASGDLALGDFTNLTFSATGTALNRTASIGTLDGDVTIDDDSGIHLSDGTLQIVARRPGVSATANIDFETTLTTTGSVELDADGNINSDSAMDAGLDISASGGIMLTAGLGIGASGNRLEVDPGTSSLSATTRGENADGSIYLLSSASLNLLGFTTDGDSTQTVDLETSAGDITIADAITSDDDWVLKSAGGISFDTGGSLTVNSANLMAATAISATGTQTHIDTSATGGMITLKGTSVGTATPLIVDPGTGTLSVNATTGGVNLMLATGDFLSSRLTLSVAGTDQTIALAAKVGRFVFDNVNGFTETDNDDFVIATQGDNMNIDFSGAFTLKADDVSLTATGSITSGTAAADLDVADLDVDGDITLVSGDGAGTGDIGASDNPFTYEPAGNVSATADGDIYLRQAAGNLATGSITTLTSTKAGGTVSIGAAAGAVDVDETDGWSLNGSLLEIVSQGNITLNDTLTAGAVRLLAMGAIVGNAGGATDIDTSGASRMGNANGSITLLGESVGAGTAVQINPGTGAVSVTATSGGVGLVWAAGDLVASNLTLEVTGNNQLIELSTADGSFVFDDFSTFTNTSTDDFVIETQGTAKNIEFAGMFTLVARNVSLIATGSIVSGGATEDLNVTGDITLVSGNGGRSAGDIGASGNEFRYKQAGSVSASADGNIYLRQVTGDLSTSSFTALTSTKAGGGVVSIGTLAGNVLVDSTTGFALTNDQLEVVAGGLGNIASFGATLSASQVRLDAGGGIGTADDSVKVQTAALTATTRGSLSAGDIYVESTGPLQLGAIATDASTQEIHLTTTRGGLEIAAASDTNDNWTITAAGDVSFVDQGRIKAGSVSLTATAGQITGNTGTSTDIDTSQGGPAGTGGDITLTGTSLGAAGTSLEVNSGTTGQLNVTATSGGVFIEFDGPTLHTNLVTLSVVSDGQTIELSTGSGSIAVDGVGGFNDNTKNDNLTLETGGSNQNITFSGATTLTGATVTLDSSGAITSGTATDVVSLVGDIILRANGNIGADGNELLIQSAANIKVDGDANIYLRQATGDLLFSRFTQLSSSASGAIVSVGTVSGNVSIDAINDQVDVDDDHLKVVAGGTGSNITFDAMLTETLEAQRVTLDARGNITSGGAGVDVKATGDAVTGGITLIAGGGIGTSSDAFSVEAGAGQVAATTGGENAAGNIYLTSSGPLRLGEIATHLSPQEIHLTTTRGGLEIAAASDTNDNWTITAAGDVSFVAPGRIKAGSVSLTATGQITGNTGTSTDIDTSQGGPAGTGGDIRLSGMSLGAAGTSLEVNSGAGKLDLTATSGGVFIEFDGLTLHTNLVTLNVVGSGQTIFLSTGSGSIAVDGVAGDPLDGTDGFNTNTQNDQFVLKTGGTNQNITFLGATTLTGASVTLDSSGAIVSGDSTDVVSTSGDIILLANGNVGAVGNELLIQPGGSLSVTAGGDIYLRQATGDMATSKFTTLTSTADGGFVSIGTINGAVIVDATMGFLLENDTLEIVSSGDIKFVGGTVVADQATLQADGSILSDSAGLDVNVDGLLVMEAQRGSIGAPNNWLSFEAQRLQTSSPGSQYLALPDEVSRTLVESIQSLGNVSLQTGNFLVLGFVFAPFGTVTVEKDALLGGGGVGLSIQTNLLLVKGDLSPGYSDPVTTRDGELIDGDASALTILGNVTVANDGRMIFDVNPPYTIAGADYDQVNVIGTLTLGDPNDTDDKTGPILVLRGGSALQQSIGGLQLTTGNVEGMFKIDDPLSPLSPLSRDRNGDIKAKLGDFFTGTLTTSGPIPGILIGNLSLVAPIQPIGLRPPAIRLPVFTPIIRPLPVVQPPPPLTPPSPPPALEVEAEKVARRELVVRIVVPIGEAGDVREDDVMKLPVEMLTDLPALLRRLPDDRYRIYLILEGSAEERLVIDVMVRDGRPIEPTDAAGDAPATVPPIAPPPDHHHDQPSGAEGPAALPDLSPAAPNLPMTPMPQQGAWNEERSPAPAGGRLYAGLGLAAAAVVAGRSTARWREQVDEAAEQIGNKPQPFWRWWRKSAAANKSSHN